MILFSHCMTDETKMRTLKQLGSQEKIIIPNIRLISDHIEHAKIANDHIEHRSAVEGIIPHKMTICKVLFCNMSEHLSPRRVKS